MQDDIDGVPTLQAMQDQFINQIELAAGVRDRDRADRIVHDFSVKVLDYFFPDRRLDDDEPIGWLLPDDCVNVLELAGIVTAGDYRARSVADLSDIRGFGESRIRMVRTILSRFGVGLREHLRDRPSTANAP